MHPPLIQQKPLILAALFSFLAAFALYGLTLAPTYGWGDSADLAIRMLDPSDTTFARSTRDYALYRSVSTLFQHLPIGDAGTRANLATAFFGACTVGIIAGFTGYLTQKMAAAYAAALALTVSHTFWLMSVIAEVYTFNALLIFSAFFAIAIWWRTRQHRYLALTSLCAGLALAHHPSGLIVCATLSPLIVLRLRTTPLSTIMLAAALFLLAALPYWQQTAAHFAAGKTLLQSLRLTPPVNHLFDASPARELFKFIAYATYNFLGPGILLAAYGLWQVMRNKTYEMLPPILWLILIVGAGITSTIPDKFNIYVLAYPVLAIAIGIAIATLNLTPRRTMLLCAALVCLPPIGYGVAIYTVRHFQYDLVHARTAPYRDNNWYFMWPGKRGDTGPRRYAEEALAAAAPNATIIADYSLWRPLYALQKIETTRPDITLTWAERVFWRGTMADYIETIPCNNPVYLATNTPPHYYQLEALEKQYQIRQQGVLFKILRECSE